MCINRDCVVSDEIWNTISPKKDSGGILCPTCLNKRLRKFGYVGGVDAKLY